jgi:hypothetical protein
MPSQKRRAAGRRRAWGRGPIILRFESLEGRQLLTAGPDLVGASFSTAHTLQWGQSFHAVGTVLNQGDTAVTVPFTVAIFASSTPTIDSNSVPLGSVTIPAGLAASQSTSFDQVFTLPPTAVPNYTSGDPIYITMWVDRDKSVPESNFSNNFGVGQGYDVSPVTITQTQPSDLIGSSIGISPTQATWGQTITVTAQVRNNAQGDAPATRARIVLTPTGLSPGSPYDYTIGYLDVPAVPAWQTVNVVQQIALPSSPPTSLAGGTQFTLSMAQDADFVTDPLTPHLANQGVGLDMTTINIAADPNATTSTSQASSVLPDPAPSNVIVGSKTLYWGYNFQVSTTLQDLSTVATGPFNVRFLLTGTDGSTAHAVFLGQTTVAGLQPNSPQVLTQTVQLPNTLPSGVSVSSSTLGRIVVVVDPDNLLNESLRSNDIADSSPVTLRVLGTDGTSTVPTSPPIGTTLGQPAPAGTVPTSPTATTTTTTAQPATTTQAAPAAATAKAPVRTKKIQRRLVPKHDNLATRIENKLKVFPSNVKNFFNDIINGTPVANTSTKAARDAHAAKLAQAALAARAAKAKQT